MLYIYPGIKVGSAIFTIHIHLSKLERLERKMVAGQDVNQRRKELVQNQVEDPQSSSQQPSERGAQGPDLISPGRVRTHPKDSQNQ